MRGFNNYTTQRWVNGVTEFVMPFVNSYCLNNRIALQMGGWGLENGQISVT